MSARQPLSADQVNATPWRNGGGVTRELLAWPSAADWRVRLSMADIARDGPFSAFDGVRRWLVLLSGRGIALSLPEGEVHLRPGDAPLAFDGAAAPGCRLLDGPVRDLNLMCRGTGRAGLQAVEPAQDWRAPPGALAGLFARVPGVWRAGRHMQALPAHSLVWCEATTDSWRFEPDTPTPGPCGWWLFHQSAEDTSS
jgi:environmental stress-induced protein Ves